MTDPEGATAPAGRTFGRHDRCCAEAAPATAEPLADTHRRRLWALGPHAHGPVIGTCLPLAVMRRLAGQALQGDAIADDYDLHCGLVADCTLRTPVAEAVQRDLDRRFLLPLRRAAAVQTEQALAAWWQAQGAPADLPGALWATLTHPRCTPALERRVLGQVHMIQHQMGMATRVAPARFEALMGENAVLARALAQAQQRSTRLAAEHAAQTAAWQSEVVRLRGLAIAAQSAVALLQEDLQAERQAQQTERIAVLQRALQQARGEIAQQRAQFGAAAASAPAATAAQAGDGPPQAPAPTDTTTSMPDPATTALARQAVLCVGGRTASVPVYRRLIERRGGRFLHHDGGEEHGTSLLESTLAAADLVICQAGCVSHNAYWRVKDHCKRTGKRCVYVETPSASSLQRALADIERDA